MFHLPDLEEVNFRGAKMMRNGSREQFIREKSPKGSSKPLTARAIDGTSDVKEGCIHVSTIIFLAEAKLTIQCKDLRTEY